MGMLGWVLTQSDWCPSEKRLGQRAKPRMNEATGRTVGKWSSASPRGRSWGKQNPLAPSSGASPSRTVRKYISGVSAPCLWQMYCMEVLVNYHRKFKWVSIVWTEDLDLIGSKDRNVNYSPQLETRRERAPGLVNSETHDIVKDLCSLRVSDSPFSCRYVSSDLKLDPFMLTR